MFQYIILIIIAILGFFGYNNYDETIVKGGRVNDCNEFNISVYNGKYNINNMGNKPITIKPNIQYSFKINTPEHPFYFSTSNVGAGDGFIGDIPNFEHPLTGIIINITFTTDLIEELIAKYGNTIYYQCMKHPNMGNIVELIPY